jgi:hypothetical protein
MSTNPPALSQPASGVERFMEAFDEALNENPFLWFELGYTRPTDWMVHVWDRSGGQEEKVLTTQAHNRDEACLMAIGELRRYLEGGE